MKYLDLYKPIYKERGDVFAGCLDDKIERIHKEGGGNKEEEGSKGYDNGGKMTRGRERRGRGTHTWRTHPTTMRYTVTSPLDKVILLMPKTNPRTMMTKRGTWW